MADNTADSFERTADPQTSSAFFSLLPAEVRNLIYREFWHLTSPRQHIVAEEVVQYAAAARPPGGRAGGRAGGGGETRDEKAPRALVWRHVPCITDPRARDVRFESFAAAPLGLPERAQWGARLRSEWCLHWACEEHDATERRRHRRRTRTGFLDLLGTCKRMYLEGLPSLYGNTTFVFTDTQSAGDFLARYGGDDGRHPLRSLELCIRATNALTEVYFPAPGEGEGEGEGEGPPAVFAGRARARPGLGPQSNPWQRVCDGLAALGGLRDLRVWFDTRDLRPWHKRVSETRLFGRLFDVRVPDRGRFVLALPELPARRGPDHEVLAGHFLEGDRLADAPFTVERGPRPNNWQLHLSGAGMLAIGA